MKNILKLLIFPVLLLSLAGCELASISGYYYSPNGDALQIKRNGEILWSPLSKTRNSFEFLAIGNMNKKKELSITFHSTSPFIGTTFTYHDENQTIEVDWKRMDGEEVKYRGSKYRKTN